MKTLRPRVSTIDTRRAGAPVVSRPHDSRAARDRERVLKRDDYLCVHCWALGRVEVAVEVDHIVPLCMGGFDSDDNKQSLCRSCHQSKSADEERERRGE
jgi:5-methylcytosine-specific restriction enzyme A